MLINTFIMSKKIPKEEQRLKSLILRVLDYLSESHDFGDLFVFEEALDIQVLAAEPTRHIHYACLVAFVHIVIYNEADSLILQVFPHQLQVVNHLTHCLELCSRHINPMRCELLLVSFLIQLALWRQSELSELLQLVDAVLKHRLQTDAHLRSVGLELCSHLLVTFEVVVGERVLDINQ